MQGCLPCAPRPPPRALTHLLGQNRSPAPLVAGSRHSGVKPCAVAVTVNPRLSHGPLITAARSLVNIAGAADPAAARKLAGLSTLVSMVLEEFVRVCMVRSMAHKQRGSGTKVLRLIARPAWHARGAAGAARARGDGESGWPIP